MTEKKNINLNETPAPKDKGAASTKAAHSTTAAKTPRRARVAGVEARYLVVASVILLAFVGSYAYAAARSSGGSGQPAWSAGGQAALAAVAGGAAGGSGSQGAGCACCGGSAGNGPVEQGAANVEGAVQRITIDTSKGYYSPNEIALKAGVPAEITFTPASGCLQEVLFPDFQVSQDISGGAVVKLPAMDPGTYQFSCGMQMVFGKLVVS